MRTSLIAVVGSLLLASAAAAADGPTFYKDVLPILQANCQTCHRPGEVAPMSLADLRAGAAVGARDQDRRRLEADAAVVCRSRLRASRQRAPARRARDRRRSRRGPTAARRLATRATAPPPLDVRERLEHQARRHRRDAEAVRACRRAARSTTSTSSSKTNFKEDMWVTAAEMRPGDPAVLHHGKVWVRPPGSKWMEKAVPGEAYERESHRDILGSNAIEEGNDILGKFNPGLGAQRFDIGGSAKFVPKGSDLVFELHYTTSGKPTRGRLEARTRAGEGAAADALLLPRRTDRAEPRHSAGRRQGGSRQRDHVRRERATGLRAAAHASPRQGLRAARRQSPQASRRPC